MKVFKVLMLLFMFGLFLPVMLIAQEREDNVDTTYIVSYPKLLTTRIYTSRKYTSFLINDRLSEEKFLYKPNSTLNLGIGATYNDLTLNVAYGFNFLNQKRDFVDSKYLDLQAHIYPRKWVIDLFGQFYKGYYLDQSQGLSIDPVYALPDMKVRKLGANVQYLFNGNKLSLKAAFLQSAWQKKSAGSLMAGFEMYGGRAENDLLIIPAIIATDSRYDFVGFRYFQFGPNIGYAHTFVIKKHFFITGVFSGNVSLGHSSQESRSAKDSSWGVSTNAFFRGFAGYNSARWSINGNYLHNRVQLVRINDFSNAIMTGNYRLNFLYRFDVGPRWKKRLDYLDPKRYLPIKKSGS